MGRAVDTKSAQLPCGAGPFRFVSWDPERGIELVRHDGFYDPRQAGLDRIVWSTNVRPETQRFELEDGVLDYARDLTATDGASLRASPAWREHLSWSNRMSTWGIALNTEMPPFDRVDVRRAVAAALDPSVLERIRPDLLAVDRILPNGLDAGNPPGSLRRHDEAAALAAMRSAGLAFDPATGRGGWPDEIDFVAVADTWDQMAGEVWQQQLARIGIRLRLRLATFAAVLSEVSRRRTVAMSTLGWNADLPTPRTSSSRPSARRRSPTRAPPMSPSTATPRSTTSSRGPGRRSSPPRGARFTPRWRGGSPTARRGCRPTARARSRSGSRT
jgi:ABC-type transport system substrate-binding protein